MKKLFLLTAAMMLNIMLSAQTQQGYVKTKGRLDSNGNLIPGKGLKGATVSVHGRTTVLVNSDDGTFSFPVPETQFHIDSVRKKGYQLVDMDVITKVYNHSANPLYLVMETPEQQLQDQLAAERKIRSTLTSQLHQKEDEIELLKEQQKISDEEYRQALQKLYEDVDQNEQLVKDMVERYSKIDYDQLSKFDQQISEYILNGELTKADSMLRTKGDIHQRIENYQRHKTINAKEKEELLQRQEQLEQSELLAQKELEDLANDCYRKFEIFKMRHENDSAAYYIELRAGLDTTNIEQLNEAGIFIQDVTADYEKALNYFQLSLRQAITQFGYQNNSVAKCYDYIGMNLNYQGLYEDAINNCKKAINALESQENVLFSHITIDIGLIYVNQGDYEKALNCYNKVLSILLPTTEQKELLISTYTNIGTMCDRYKEYDKAIINYNKALVICESAFAKDHHYYGIINNNIGHVYYNLGNYDKALEYYIIGLNNRLCNFGELHPSVATSYNNIALVYKDLYENEKALEYLEKSIIIKKEFFGNAHPCFVTSYNNIASLYSQQHDYTKALEYYEKSLDIKMKLSSDNHPDLAIIYNNIGNIYSKQNEYKMALDYFEKAQLIFKNNFGDSDPNLAVNYMSIAIIYYKLGDSNKAIDSLNKAILILKKHYGEQHPNLASCYKIIGEIYSKLGQDQTAIEYYQKCLTIRTCYFKEDHPKIVEIRQKISEIQAKLKEQENEQKTEE